MKDYVNPVLLLAVIILMACRATAETAAVVNRLEIWILTLCVSEVLVNGALALARALTHRPSLMSVVWAMTFLVLGSCTWAVREMPTDEEMQAYQELYATHQQNPLARDAEGETLLTRAAALGKTDTVRDILNRATPPMELIQEAGLRAAEGNHTAVLEQLAKLGMTANAAHDGVPLLHAAAQNGSCEAMEWLLTRGADPNARDAEGTTPLIHATLSGSVKAVRALLKHGADMKQKDAQGKSAADFARGEELLQLLDPLPQDDTPDE